MKVETKLWYFSLFFFCILSITAANILLKSAFFLPTSQSQAVSALGPSVNRVFLGTSHAQYGIDPREFREKTVVLAAGFLDYVSMNRIWKSHQERLGDVKQVVLEIGAGSMYLNRLAANEITPQELIDLELFRVIPLYDQLRNPDFLIRRLIRPILLYRFSPKTLREYKEQDKTKFARGESHPGFDPLGGTSSREDVRTKGKEKIAWIEEHTSEATIEENRARILDLVESITNKKIELVLLRYPLHPEALSVIPDKWIQEVESTRGLISRRFNRSFKYINYLYSSEIKPEDFRDADHLNQDGAKKLSRLLRERL